MPNSWQRPIDLNRKLVGTSYIFYGLIPRETRLVEGFLTRGPRGRACLSGAAVGRLCMNLVWLSRSHFPTKAPICQSLTKCLSSAVLVSDATRLQAFGQDFDFAKMITPTAAMRTVSRSRIGYLKPMRCPTL